MKGLVSKEVVVLRRRGSGTSEGLALETLVFISLIRACVSNEILERGSSIRGGEGGGSTPRNSRWGCATRFFKTRPYFRPKHAIFRTFIRSRGSLEKNTRFQTIMVKIYIRFKTKTAQKAYSLGRHIPI